MIEIGYSDAMRKVFIAAQGTEFVSLQDAQIAREALDEAIAKAELAELQKTARELRA